MASLNDLVKKPGPDLRPQFKSFTEALDQLLAAAERGPGTAIRMVHSNAAYIAAWDKELASITNATLRSLSQARKAEVTDQFNAANRDYADAQRALWSLVYHVSDFHKALSLDLTPSGMQAITALLSDVTAEAGKVQAALAQVNRELTAFSTAMSSARGPSRT
jgi:hypothetical protein